MSFTDSSNVSTSARRRATARQAQSMFLSRRKDRQAAARRSVEARSRALTARLREARRDEAPKGAKSDAQEKLLAEKLVAGSFKRKRSFSTEYPANGSFFRPQSPPSLARAKVDKHTCSVQGTIAYRGSWFVVRGSANRATSNEKRATASVSLEFLIYGQATKGVR